MKQVSTTLYLLLLCFFLSCSGRKHNGDVNITLSESGEIYRVEAEYDESKTKAVERCMNSELAKNSSMSFTNTRIDGVITLDDRTTFYIKKKSGLLKIKFDKDKNSSASYHTMKTFAEELKLALQK